MSEGDKLEGDILKSSVVLNNGFNLEIGDYAHYERYARAIENIGWCLNLDVADQRSETHPDLFFVPLIPPEDLRYGGAINVYPNQHRLWDMRCFDRKGVENALHTDLHEYERRWLEFQLRVRDAVQNSRGKENDNPRARFPKYDDNGELKNITMDDFSIDKSPIGRGSSGIVYKAVTKSTEEKVVLKIIDDESNIAAEVRTYVKLGPDAYLNNIPRFYGWFYDRSSETHVVVMEYVSGGDLKRLVVDDGTDGVNLNDYDKLAIIHDVFKAVAFCHSRGVVHHDIKLENCLYARRDVRKNNTKIGVNTGSARFAGYLTDFDLSEHNLYELQDEKGTPYYFPPEFFKHEYPYTYAIDYWALGMMVLAMFNKIKGRTAFEDRKTLFALLRVVKYFSDDNINDLKKMIDVSNSSVESIVNSLISNLMRVDPNERVNPSLDHYIDNIGKLLESKEVSSPTMKSRQPARLIAYSMDDEDDDY